MNEGLLFTYLRETLRPRASVVSHFEYNCNPLNS